MIEKNELPNAEPDTRSVPPRQAGRVFIRVIRSIGGWSFRFRLCRAELFRALLCKFGDFEVGFFGLSTINYQLSTIPFALLCSDFGSSRIMFHVSRNLAPSDQN